MLLLGLRLSISSSLVFYKKKVASNIIIYNDVMGQEKRSWRDQEVVRIKATLCYRDLPDMGSSN